MPYGGHHLQPDRLRRLQHTVLRALRLPRTRPLPRAPACKNPSCVSQEYFGSSADHGRSVLGDYHILQNKYPQTHHLVQARAASQPPSFLFHIAEFLIR